jgi:hypothetical protein
MHVSIVMRKRIWLILLAVLSVGALPAATAASVSKPVIKGEEVGFFGGATVTHRIDVFVYSSLGPSAGNQVTVCVAGHCQKAHGHDARTAWYHATFRTRGLRMGEKVSFAVVASDSAGRASVKVTKDLLCMHNDGSTPQT